MEFDEELEVTAVGPVGGIDAVLEMGEASVVALVGDGQGKLRFASNGTHIVSPDLDFELGEAVEEPGVTSDGGDEDFLLGVGGLEAEEEGVFEIEESEGVFAYDGGDWAKMPCLSPLAATTALPAAVRGPVDFRELRRLASICLMDGIRSLN